MNEKNASQRRVPPYAWSMPGWPSPTQSDADDALEVWGYADRMSYRAGEVVRLHVSATRASYSLKVFRDGAVPENVFERTGLPGTRHAVPGDAYASGCGWPVALEIPVEEHWKTGLYIVVLRIEDGRDLFESDAFFVVRNTSREREGIAFVLTTSTLIAYNDWGGANHYRGLGNDPREDIASPVLSTQRPLGRGFLRKPAEAPRESHSFDPPIGWQPRYPSYEWARLHDYCRHHADSFWATYERLFAVWAEENGYGLDYLTQHDLHFDPDCLDGYRALVIVGHDEYWTWEMRDRVDAFVDAGGGLARFGGNFLWQVRLSDDGHTQSCYRVPGADPLSDANPRRTTTVWDCTLIDRPAAATMGLTGMSGVYNRYGVAAPRSSGGFTVYRPDHWAFEGTDLYYGDLLGGTPVNIATFELDAVEYTFRRGLPYPTFEDGAPESLEILAMAPAVRGEEDRFDGEVPLNGPIREMQETMKALGDLVPAHHHDLEGRGAGMIAAFSRGGGEVFNGGSTEWPRALELRDPFTERIVANVLDRFLRR